MALHEFDRDIWFQAWTSDHVAQRGNLAASGPGSASWRRPLRGAGSGAAIGRPAAPSRRVSRAKMGRAAFLLLIAGWLSACAILLIVALVIRRLG
jgi:hypothetical protein